MKTTAKILMAVALTAVIPGSATADPRTVDQITRCNKPVPAPLTWFVAFIPCWALANQN